MKVIVSKTNLNEVQNDREMIRLMYEMIGNLREVEKMELSVDQREAMRQSILIHEKCLNRLFESLNKKRDE